MPQRVATRLLWYAARTECLLERALHHRLVHVVAAALTGLGILIHPPPPERPTATPTLGPHSGTSDRAHRAAPPNPIQPRRRARSAPAPRPGASIIGSSIDRATSCDDRDRPSRPAP